jgi:hypothetical protein
VGQSKPVSMVPAAVDSGLGTVAGVARYLVLFVIHHTFFAHAIIAM